MGQDWKLRKNIYIFYLVHLKENFLILGHNEVAMKLEFVNEMIKLTQKCCHFTNILQERVFWICTPSLMFKALVLRIPKCYALTLDLFFEVNFDQGGLCQAKSSGTVSEKKILAENQRNLIFILLFIQTKQRSKLNYVCLKLIEQI